MVKIEDLKTLSTNYTQFLLGELQKRLGHELPEQPAFEFCERDWGLSCERLYEGWQLGLKTPAHGPGGNPERKFLAMVYLNSKAGEARLQRVGVQLAHLEIEPEGRGHWWTNTHEDRESAIVGLCEIARVVCGSAPA